MLSEFINKPLMLDSKAISAFDENRAEKAKYGRMTYCVRDNIAIIPIHGILTRRSECFLSETSYEEIFEAIEEAQENSEVKGILLDIDSPGGEVSGLFDLVDYIYTVRERKPICAVANDNAFSAAYAIASAASRVFINRTSGVGSIGVIATHTDISEANKQMGVKYTTIFAGAKKNDLSANAPLSEEAAADLQAEVNRLYEIFVETVARNRGIDAEKVRMTQAGCYYGENAIDIGLADELGEPLSYFKKSSAVLEVSNHVFKGAEKMAEKTEEINAGGVDALSAYQAEISEIINLCKIAKAENRICDFLEKKMTVEDVKKALLAAQSSTREIVSVNYRQETKTKNPLMVAVKKIANVK